VSDDPSGAVGWVRALVFEAEDLGRAADFWQALLGVELIDRRDDWIQLGRDRGGIYLGFLPAQGGRPSAIRARPDIQVPDLDAATARIEALGGRLLSIDKDPEGEHRVMADTEGNEFTILGPLPQDEAARIGLA
jgi:predicted enzyme related to lactoylglutathione lyase